MPPTGPSTAVIGAGISGLTASKMLGDYGVPYTCFESSDRIGGNWAFGNPNGHSSAYRSLHIDTSKHRLSFKDFPMPDDYPDFPHHTQIKAYLDSYAEAFGLLDRIEFENGVTHAEPNPDGGWEITDQAGATRHFDLLVVANGHHWDPRMADFPGEFTGESIHSHHYIDPKTPLDLFGKRIVVVGIGNSAADIAVELSSKTLQNEVVLSTRSSAWIVPKYMYGLPADKYFVTSPHIPLAWQRKVVQKMQFMTGSNPELYGLPKPNHKFFEAHPTQSVELPLRLGSGDIVPKPNIARLDGATVHFEDGTSGDFDVIVYATGYNITFPFFDEDYISAPDNRIRLFKRMFKPGRRRPGVHGLRPGGADALPVRRGAGPAARGVRRRPLRATVGGRDGGDHRRRQPEVHGPRPRPAAAHPPDGLLPLRARPAGQGDPRGAGSGGRGMTQHDTTTSVARGDRRRTALLEALDHHLRQADRPRPASTRSTSPTSRGARESPARRSTSTSTTRPARSRP